MSFATWAQDLRSGSPEGTISALPYADLLGLRYRYDRDGLILVMPFDASLIGSPMPPRLHGGTIAGLLEITALSTLLIALPSDELVPRLKPINVTVDYLREGRSQDTSAAATVTRLGRRIANLRVEAWQDDRAKPIAGAHLNILLDRA